MEACTQGFHLVVNCAFTGAMNWFHSDDGSEDLAFWFHFLLLQYTNLDFYLKSTETFWNSWAVGLNGSVFITAVIASASDTTEPKNQLVWKVSASRKWPASIVVHTVKSQWSYLVEKSHLSIFFPHHVYLDLFSFRYSRNLNAVNICCSHSFYLIFQVHLYIPAKTVKYFMLISYS